MDKDSNLSTQTDKTEQKSKVLDAVSSWLKLLALMVLSVEAVLIFGLARSSENDPMRGWYIPLMLIFFSVIVIGLFFDRYIQANLAFAKDKLDSSHKDSGSRSDTEISKNLQKTQDDFETIRTRYGGFLRLELANDIAVVSPELRKESTKKLLSILVHKMNVHRNVFLYSHPSAIIPINAKYFGRFSWDEKRIICHELFEIPEDTDIEYWKIWSSMQSMYVRGYSAPHRQAGNEGDQKSLLFLSDIIKSIINKAKELISNIPELNQKGNAILIDRVENILENIDYNDRSKTQTNAVVQLELALSTVHDLIKRFMPRIISI